MHIWRSVQVPARGRRTSTPAKGKYSLPSLAGRLVQKKKGENCNYEHQEYAQSEVHEHKNRANCRHWQACWCNYGENCKFQHADYEQQHSSSVAKETEISKSDRICVDWMEGTCAYGQSCRFKHEYHTEKSDRICKDWLDWKCGYGDACRFRHEEW